MGYYLQTPRNVNKANQLKEIHKDVLFLPSPPKWDEIPKGKALVCVVNNSAFEAASYCYDERELKEFSDPEDRRKKTWLLMDEEAAKLASDYPN